MPVSDHSSFTTPKQMAERKRLHKEIKEAEQEGPEIVDGDQLHGEIKGASPLAIELSGILTGVFWTHQKRILDHMEVLCHSDRQWQTVRRIAQDIQGEQLRQTSGIVRQYLTQALGGKE